MPPAYESGRRRTLAAGAIFAALIAAFCGGEGEGRITWLDTPAPTGSRVPGLASGDGKLVLSWVEEAQPGSRRLRFATGSAGSWEQARTIAEGEQLRLNWSDSPSLLVLEDGSWAVQWATARGPQTFDMVFSLSPDGESWGDELRPASGGTSAQRGWVDLIPEGRATVGLVWLETREPATRLIYRRWNGREFEPQEVLDDDVCPWCRASAVRVGSDLLVAYRDHEAEEVRDVSLTRRHQGRWEAARPLHRDGWQLAGCPVNGPVLTTEGSQVAAAWFTAADATPRVLLAHSDSSGAFGEPVRVDEGDPLGRVDAVMLEDGSVFVAWLESAPRGAEVRLRRVDARGGVGPPRVLGITEAGSESGFPRMERVDRRLYVSWTEPGPPSRIRLASLRI